MNIPSSKHITPKYTNPSLTDILIHPFQAFFSFAYLHAQLIVIAMYSLCFIYANHASYDWIIHQPNIIYIKSVVNGKKDVANGIFMHKTKHAKSQ